ncbi:hypothetical protein I79_016986 [Cricetulus griseus]|uniref:Uncharacterized protein n=1 Tax=Cricetulus griseus TaxID=10029 RepID=G3I0U5_CRIGR|nr:hypothetical protein I79_016986 [Cricetulus griseus]
MTTLKNEHVAPWGHRLHHGQRLSFQFELQKLQALGFFPMVGGGLTAGRSALAPNLLQWLTDPYPGTPAPTQWNLIFGQICFKLFVTNKM